MSGKCIESVQSILDRRLGKGKASLPPRFVIFAGLVRVSQGGKSDKEATGGGGYLILIVFDV